MRFLLFLLLAVAGQASALFVTNYLGSEDFSGPPLPAPDPVTSEYLSGPYFQLLRDRPEEAALLTYCNTPGEGDIRCTHFLREVAEPDELPIIWKRFIRIDPNTKALLQYCRQIRIEPAECGNKFITTDWGVSFGALAAASKCFSKHANDQAHIDLLNRMFKVDPSKLALYASGRTTAQAHVASGMHKGPSWGKYQDPDTGAWKQVEYTYRDRDAAGAKGRVAGEKEGRNVVRAIEGAVGITTVFPRARWVSALLIGAVAVQKMISEDMYIETKGIRGYIDAYNDPGSVGVLPTGVSDTDAPPPPPPSAPVEPGPEFEIDIDMSPTSPVDEEDLPEITIDPDAPDVTDRLAACVAREEAEVYRKLGSTTPDPEARTEEEKREIAEQLLAVGLCDRIHYGEEGCQARQNELVSTPVNDDFLAEMENAAYLFNWGGMCSTKAECAALKQELWKTYAPSSEVKSIIDDIVLPSPSSPMGPGMAWPPPAPGGTPPETGEPVEPPPFVLDDEPPNVTPFDSDVIWINDTLPPPETVDPGAESVDSLASGNTGGGSAPQHWAGEL